MNSSSNRAKVRSSGRERSAGADVPLSTNPGRQLRSATKKQPPSPLRPTLENSTDNSNNIKNNNISNKAPVVAKKKPPVKMKVILEKKEKSILEKLPEGNTEKIQWLLDRRSSLPKESVVEAFQSPESCIQFCLDFRRGMKSNVCQHLELMDQLLQLVDGFGSEQMVLHLFRIVGACCMEERGRDASELSDGCSTHCRIPLLALKVLSTFFRTKALNREENNTAIILIVLVMKYFHRDVPIQCLGVQILHQYVVLSPDGGKTEAMVKVEGCMECLAAASNRVKDDPVAQHSIRFTTKSIGLQLTLVWVNEPPAENIVRHT